MNYNIHYDIAALVVGVVVLVHFLNQKRIGTLQSKIFFQLILCSFVSNMIDIFTVMLGKLEQPVWLGYVSNMIYLMSFNVIPVIYYTYFQSTIRDFDEWRLKDKVAMLMPISLSYILILTTPFTKLIFTYDDNGYRHSDFFPVLYLISFLYMFMTLYLSFKYRSRMTRGQRMSVYFYNLSCLGAIILQMQYNSVLLLHFVVAISIMLAYLSLENPKNDEDNRLGIYNRVAFIKRINSAVNAEKEFNVIGINLIGYQSVRETLGVDSCELFLKQIVDTLLPKIRPMRMFSIMQGQFVLFTDDKSLDLNQIISRIQAEFINPVKFQEIEVAIGVYLYALNYPDNVQNAADIMDIVDYSEEMAAGNMDGVIMHASEEILWKKRRENRIEQIMQYALRENGFEVYYQPIYSVHEKCYNSAEALVRLHDEELGFISPEEFIPMAEKNGLILEIGEFVFRSVCSMLSSRKLWERGLNYVEVNLSVVQCMQDTLHERLIGIMEEYGVPYNRINLEITETAAIVSKETLLQNMERLIARGTAFSLDDYGTGYSNISNIIKYPFNLIKLDKSMVMSAMEDERATLVLKHTIAMLKELKLDIVAEGVENERQAKLLEDMGCDFFQGYYYSKPVPVSELMSLI